MKVVVSFPPGAYPFMPYLAPFLLKGYLETNSTHRVATHDLNIEYYRHIWSAAFNDQAATELAAAERRAPALTAELLASRAEASYLALRRTGTYEDFAAVRANAWILKEADRVVTALDSSRGIAERFSHRLGAWDELLDTWQVSVAARFIEERVDAGLYDGAGVVGLCLAYAPQILPGLALARSLKRRRPEVRVVLGGGAITHFLPEVLRDRSLWSNVDFVIPFEGEYSFLELLDSLERGDPPPAANVASCGEAIVYRRELVNRPRVEAAPDFSDLVHLYPTPEPIYPLLTSKGCYWGKCRFCTHHEGYGQGYSRLNDALVERSVNDLIGKGARRFYFVDEALPPRKLTDLARTFEAARERLGEAADLGWTAEARLEKSLVEPVAADLLARSGCRLLVNGIESGCPETLDAMQKGLDLTLVERHARQCAAVGVRTGWMFFVGYPTETPAQARQTFDFIERNAGYLDFASVGYFRLERGAPIWADLPGAGISRVFDIDKPYPSTFDFELQDGTIVTPELLQARLTGLYQEYPQLRSLFTGAVDRALALFFPVKPAGLEKRDRPGQPLTIDWDSELLGRPARLDLNRRRIEVL